MDKWKYIPSYEGLYMANKEGDIKTMGKGDNTNAKERLLKPSIFKKSGYKYVELCKNGIYKKITVHRLIALTFIPNTENKPCVNHKNGVKTDNRVENLEWVTKSENTKHAYDNGLMKASKPWLGKKGHLNPGSKIVIQYDMNNNYINKYYGISEASRSTGISQGNIWAVANSIRKSAGNYKWAYE